MQPRPCPVCGARKARIIMRFTPELLSAINPTYRLDVLRRAIGDRQEHLAYSRCTECGMVYCTYQWDGPTLGAVYQQCIDHEKSRRKILKIEKRLTVLRTWSNILRVLKLRGLRDLDGLKLIDYGCGWGDFLDVATGYGIQAAGYDEDAIKAGLAAERGHTIFGDLHQLEAFAPVDVFVMNSVLEHLQDIAGIFKLIDQVLKPDGLLVFSVMDYRKGFLARNVMRVNGGRPALTKNLNPVEHVNIYDYHSVLETLARQGYDFISTGSVLYFTDSYFTRNRMFFVQMLNLLERLSTRVLTSRELYIEVYASKAR